MPQTVDSVITATETFVSGEGVVVTSYFAIEYIFFEGCFLDIRKMVVRTYHLVILIGR
jgi:hypothetical protein